jgi:Flp pilus assembly pilin Flp
MSQARSSNLLNQEDGVTAIETALIMPVLLFGVMMIFELARIALTIAIGSLALETALQDFRVDRAFYQQSPDTLQQAIEERLVDASYGLLERSELLVELLVFDNLRQFGGGQADAELDDSDSLPPVLSVTVDMRQRFITPLPALFGLGDAFQYQYRQLLGNLTSETDMDEEE